MDSWRMPGRFRLQKEWTNDGFARIMEKVPIQVMWESSQSHRGIRGNETSDVRCVLRNPAKGKACSRLSKNPGMH